ncbi:glycoside hydrolase family 32 protein [Agriterribacter sp.]|mgnify:CR=1 FL=1|uniref:glycoside hydrolase family 32 protein n=1 Tax=Agriterribacter sp. TaxID=2821509 RepID=UPI002C224CA5|nr:glycoside hydrolase family 32 protein [Agriterribacter sp.]HRO45872.1 glycoside hydrolase family 32 protein [Agriterribacter sp.]HRQ18947.1 glycoside hydrolase family 32 protein [Agriterribacter sp.]
MNRFKSFFLVLACFMSACCLAQQKEEKPLIEEGKDIPAAVIRSTREFRERLLTDPYRPAYHFSFPEGDGRPGDPNGAFYHNGLYHLMFLYKRTDGKFAWGHASSKDMLHWRYHRDALVPGDGDEGCFSGGAFVDDDGSAILSYWMLWGAKGIGLAKSNDATFSNWEKFKANPVIKSTEWGITEMKDASGKPYYVGSADPSNIWKKDGKYYMLTGNLLVLRKFGSRGAGLPANMEEGTLPLDSLNYQGDRLYLFESDNLNDWTYKHEFYKADRKWTEKTEDNMCPSFLPLPSSPDGGKSDKHLMLFISHNLGCQYYIGSYINDRFLPDTHGRMTWTDNAYFAPEALVDNKGRQIMWAWIFDDRPDSLKNYHGWNGIYGLPRSLWVNKDGGLGMKPVEELKSLRINAKERRNITLAANTETTLYEQNNDLLEMEVTFQAGTAKQAGVVVGRSADGKEETVIYYDAAEKKLKLDATKSSVLYGRRNIESAPFELKKGENLTLNIFIDRGIIEVFVNDRQAIARTVYPTLGGTGIKLFSNGGAAKVIAAKTWDIVPSNPY